ncbi:J domain-containing protein [Vibrio tapetis subsp. quintayensis]|uniref:J domain-containing protein n=1 Tax=Vibrio tapetis TaxID=52443 RepID=UPI0025B5DEC1|nr:J domain-containing protein [Vibrio tapetis]MDN3679967.1 J domain-containing protein [Vibrio tapetis subsp. quintayensis]
MNKSIRLLCISALFFSHWVGALTISELETQANKQDPVAQYSLAQAFFTGKDVAKDSQRAIDWLKQSANNGYSLAQLKLANAYDSGIAIEQNLERAVYWYTKAAVQGLARAQLKLGILYEREYNEYQSVADLDLAKVWYKVAFENNSAQAEAGYNRVLEAKFNAMRAAQLGQITKLDDESSKVVTVASPSVAPQIEQESKWALPEVTQEVGYIIIAVTFLIALLAVILLGRKKRKQKTAVRQEKKAADDSRVLRKELEKTRRQLVSQNAVLKDLKHAQQDQNFTLACTFLGLNSKRLPSADVIKTRYKKLCRVYHPDANGSDDEMKKLNAALKVILKHPSYNK